jgi:hypothetical protein
MHTAFSATAGFPARCGSAFTAGFASVGSSPSVAHIPWVTLKFLLTDVVFGHRQMTRARWNNVLAPVLLPLVSAPLGPMIYCMIAATKR